MKAGDIYRSNRGYLFEIVTIAKHGQSCDIEVVVYKSITDTLDASLGQVWVIDKQIFGKRMEFVRGGK